MLGEEDPTEPRSFARQSIPTRIVVLAAGATMNAIFAVVLFTLSFMLPRDTITGQVIVNKVVAGSPAEAAGLQPGDVILQVNDREVHNLADLGYDIRLNLGNDTELRLRRDVYEGRRRMSSDFKNVSVVPRWNYPVGQGPVGIEIGMLTAKPDIEQYPFWEAIPLGLQRSLDVMTITKNELLSTIVRRVAPPVAGPIGIAQLSSQVADQGGFSQMIEFMALLSVNLAVMNILPIPMLDGGRILFVVIELVRRGKRVPPEKEGVVHFIGLMVLLMFLAVVSYQDIVRIINGDSLVR
jgi:regulator of sigma E protease